MHAVIMLLKRVDMRNKRNETIVKGYHCSAFVTPNRNLKGISNGGRSNQLIFTLASSIYYSVNNFIIINSYI